MTQPSTALFRFEAPLFTEEAFEPYALAMGQANLAWNDLHEFLGRLFGNIVEGHSRVQPLAIWQSSRADRGKRAMLKAAVEAAPQSLKDTFPKMVADVCWLLGRTEALEEPRNNIIHAPLHLVTDEMRGLTPGNTTDEVKRRASVEPHYWGGNERATKLMAKDILSEYDWCRETAVELRNFTLRMDRCLSSEPDPWPDRPKLPIHRAPSLNRPGTPA